MDKIESSKASVEECSNALAEEGFIVVQDLIDPEQFRLLCRLAKTYFSSITLDHHACNLPKALRGAVSAGMPNITGFTDSSLWKVYRSCFFHWNSAPVEVRPLISASRKCAAFRNRICNLPKYYGEKIEDSGYIQYTSLSLYPSSGGFLRRHSDGHKSERLDSMLIHTKLDLSIKGEDYTDGGFMLTSKKGIEYNISDIVSPGDVLIFDASCPHSVLPTYGSGLGRIGLFDIPTYVTKRSRQILYSDGNPSLASSIKHRLSQILR